VKKCLYCSEKISPKDSFEKIGKEHVCILCAEDANHTHDFFDFDHDNNEYERFISDAVDDYNS
jgi:hypothetical protein